MDDFLFDPERSSMEQPAQPELPRKITSIGTVIPPQPAAPAAPQPGIPQQPYAPVNYYYPPQTAPEPKKKRNGLWLTLAVMTVALALVLGIVAVAAAGLRGYTWNDSESVLGGVKVNPITQSNTPITQIRTDLGPEDLLTTQEILKKVNPSVVTVSVRVQNPSTREQSSRFGSGVIFSENGYIITNAHVVVNATEIAVRTYDGTVYKTKLVGYDEPSDVAVIKADASGLTPAEFGRSANLIPGDKVVAIGTPYAQSLYNTATEGIVSALRKNFYFESLGYTLDVIQHSAPINSGNSGGPLINEYGQVVGINSIKIAGNVATGTYENIGFALPIDNVLPLAEKLMQDGKISHPGIGIKGYTYYADETATEGDGVFISEILAGGGAQRAELQVGDVIVEADHKQVKTIDELKEIINTHTVGDVLPITYVRNGETNTAMVGLREMYE